MILQHTICSKCGEPMDHVGSYGQEEIWRCMECGNYNYIREGEEIMTANKEWPCEHVTRKQNEWTFDAGGLYTMDAEKFIQCPMCPAKRPEEPKALWELYRDAELAIGCYREVTMVALKWFKENLPKGDIFRHEIIELLEKEMDKCK